MAAAASSVRSTFFGTSSVHVTDGVSGILIDGFFTRPSLLRVTVEATRPDLIIPGHWDDFGRPLNKKLRPMPRVLDNFAKTKELLDRRSTESGTPVRFQKPYETITPFN